MGRQAENAETDSPNRIEDADNGPDGLCADCQRDCYSDWYIVLCSEYKEGNNATD